MAHSRGSNWTTELTKVLAELKSSGLKWQEIASRISTQSSEEDCKSDKQCRRRWETLKKVYDSIEDYCRSTRRAHTNLTQEEIQNLNKSTKATAYNAEWYSIVKEVCDRRPPAGMATEPSNTRLVCDPLQVRSPSRNIQYRGESSTQFQTNIVPMSVDRSSASHIQQYGAASIAGAMGINQPQNSFGRFELPGWGLEDANDMRSYQSMSETKISTASGFSEQPLEFTADGKWADSLIVTPKGKQVETNIVPRSVERKSPSHNPQYGAVNIAGCLDQLEAFDPLEIPPLSTTEADAIRSYQSMSSTKITTACGIFSEQFETVYVLDGEAPDHISLYGVENIAGDLDIYQLEAFGSRSEIPSWRNIDMRLYQSLYESKMSMAGGIFKKSLDEDWYPSDWKADIETPLESEHETERETEQEIELVQTNIVPMSVDRSSASHDPRFGAVNIAGAMGINEPQNSFGVFELSPWGPDDANCMRFISQIPSSNSTVMEAELCVQSSEFIQKTDSNSDLQSVSSSRGVKSM